MVVFTCNSCGESLKKNKVAQHLYQCKSSSLTCVDCQKDFTNDYNSHNECISEDQKYGGLDFQPKEKSSKGKTKQEEWLTKIKSAIDKSQCTPHIKSLMQRLISYDNIPRKRKKFDNFIRNCLRVTNDYYIQQMWDICESSFGSEVNGTSKPNNDSNNSKRSLNESDVQTNKQKKHKPNGTEDQNHTQNGVEEANGESNSGITESINQTEDDLNLTQDIKPKLKIKKIVIEILKNRENNELSLKKLRKRVWKTFKQVDDNYSRETIVSKFDQKIHSIKKIVINDGKVSLKS